ncbi:hypothetical protein ABZP36_021866 [Zizania latifolia]
MQPLPIVVALVVLSLSLALLVVSVVVVVIDHRHLLRCTIRHTAEEQGGTSGYHIGDGAIFIPPPELPRRRPNASDKSSSNLTAGNFPPLAAAHGLVASAVGMAAPGMAAADRLYLPRMAAAAPAASQLENWGDSGLVVSSPFTDPSTDVDDSTDKHHHALMGCAGAGGEQRGVDSSVVSKERTGDHKIERRLAQNREAARKSRMRKKAYIQQLESSRSKLTHLEQELHRARQQGIFIASGGSGDSGLSVGGNGVSSARNF